jgi:putative glutathione S-transferase
MAPLVNGEMKTKWLDTESSGGEFVRYKSTFLDTITADGASGFKAEADRYHLYVSLACPWAHRTLIFRKIKKLEDVISVSIVDPLMGEMGWSFSSNPGCVPDTVNKKEFLYEIYQLSEPKCNAVVSVPVLWDKLTSKIVNNESSDIIRMLNSEFDAFGDASIDLYPEELRGEIDEVNSLVYENVNNGVYKCGFATTQEAYVDAFDSLFKTLDLLEVRLSNQRFLAGSKITEADWRLFTTLVRFDPVYVGHFKCNLKRIIDYPNLSNYLRELYQYPGVKETVNMEHIKNHYYRSHPSVNPTGIVAKGPSIDLDAPHDRGRFD